MNDKLIEAINDLINEIKLLRNENERLIKINKKINDKLHSIVENLNSKE